MPPNGVFFFWFSLTSERSRLAADDPMQAVVRAGGAGRRGALAGLGGGRADG